MRTYQTTREILHSFSDDGLAQALQNMRTFTPSGSIGAAIRAGIIRAEIARRAVAAASVQEARSPPS